MVFNLLSQQHSETYTNYWENSHKHSHYFCKGRVCYIAKCLRRHLEQLYVLGLCMWHFLTTVLPLFSLDNNLVREELQDTVFSDHKYFPVLLTLLPQQT